ncbi:MAG: DUF4339 domain-containing protein [Thermoguttaceae bacterium]|nr:DUF4339 domain-containing protein [Thermoguttaceae bacterium]
MEIYYFGTNGEKIGPITKEGLLNLAQAGVISEETRFEVGGKKYKGKQIKNLRPIFEQLKAAAPEPETPPEAPAVVAPPAPGELPPPVERGPFPHPDADPFAGFSIEEDTDHTAPPHSDAAPLKADPIPNREEPQNKSGGLKTFLLLDENKSLAYNEFWNSYKIAKRLITALYFVIAAILLIAQMIALAAYISNLPDSGTRFIAICAGLFGLVIAQAILFIIYRLILLPYYWMASMIGSAEDIRIIKQTLLEK